MKHSLQPCTNLSVTQVSTMSAENRLIMADKAAINSIYAGSRDLTQIAHVVQNTELIIIYDSAFQDSSVPPFIPRQVAGNTV